MPWFCKFYNPSRGQAMGEAGSYKEGCLTYFASTEEWFAMSLAYGTDSNLGQAIFGHAQLGDRRRTARLVETFNLMRRHPGGTLPDKLSAPADLRAFYRLCDADDVTHGAIIAAAREYT